MTFSKAARFLIALACLAMLGLFVSAGSAFAEGDEGDGSGSLRSSTPDTVMYWGIVDDTLYLANFSSDSHSNLCYPDSFDAYPPWTGEYFTHAEVDGTLAPAIIDCWFENMDYLESVDLSGLDTSHVTDMSWMFCSSDNLSSIEGLSSWDTHNVTDMSYMFCGLDGLVTPPDVSSWDTGNVTTMEGMFSECDALESPPNTASWDTHNVTNMKEMFCNCFALVNPPNVYLWDTGNVTDMSRMFYRCWSMTEAPDVSLWNVSKVTDLTEFLSICQHMERMPDMSDWNTSSVTSMKNLFCMEYENTESAAVVKYLPDISGWDTHNVTDMSGLFANCVCVEDLPDISGWDIGKVTDMSGMFSWCQQARAIPDLSNWDTHSVTDMGSLFSGCERITSLPPLDTWDTHNVITMEGMFDGCAALEVFPHLSSWNKDSLVTISYMFSGCSSWPDPIDIYSLDAPQVKYMRGLFSFCQSTHLPDISSWDTSHVIDMSYMFAHCSNLTEFQDISNWNTGNVTDMEGMFYECSVLPDMSSWDTHNVTSMKEMFRFCSVTTLPDLSQWNTGKVTDMRSMFSQCEQLERPPATRSWNMENVKDLSSMFSYCPRLTLPPDTSNWDTHSVTTMAYMFDGCSALAYPPDTSSWDTHNVTSMLNMFNYCRTMNSAPNMTSWNTSKVTNMRNMFDDCRSMQSADISHFDTSSIVVGTFSGHVSFKADGALKSLTVSSSTKIGGTFPTHSATGNYLSTWKNADNPSQTSKTPDEMLEIINNGQGAGTWVWETVEHVTFKANGGGGYQSDITLPSDLPVPECTFRHPDNALFYNWNTSPQGDGTPYNVGDPLPTTDTVLYAQWVSQEEARSGYAYAVLTSSDDDLGAGTLIFVRSTEEHNASLNSTVEDIFGNHYTGRVYTGFEDKTTPGAPWYDQHDQITSIKTGYDQIISPKNMSQWFTGCSAASSCKLDNFDVSQVTDMSQMFFGCSVMSEFPDTTYWSTGNVTDLSSMFEGCALMEFPIRTSNWNTSSVTDMSSMFKGCSYLYSAPYTYNWNMSSVTDLSSMFEGCSSLYNVPSTASWDTHAVTDMSKMFKGCIVLGSSPSVSSWDTSSLLSTSEMFANCESDQFDPPRMENWTTPNITDMSGMFDGCSGTRFNFIDISKCNMDGITSPDNYIGFAGAIHLSDMTVSASTRISDSFPEHEAQGTYFLSTWRNYDNNSQRGCTAAQMIEIINSGEGEGAWIWEVPNATFMPDEDDTSTYVLADIDFTSDYTMPECVFTKTLYDFSAWKVVYGGTGTYEAGSTLPANTFAEDAQVTFVATWKPHEFSGVSPDDNPDEDGDGYGDNLAFSVPTAINYVVMSDGELVGPDEARIENKSAFGIRISSLKVTPESDWNIVESVSGTDLRNAAELELGAGSDMLNLSNYLSKRPVSDTRSWLVPKATPPSRLIYYNDALAAYTAGTLTDSDLDMTEYQTWAKVNGAIVPWTLTGSGNTDLTDLPVDIPREVTLDDVSCSALMYMPYEYESVPYYMVIYVSESQTDQVLYVYDSEGNGSRVLSVQASSGYNYDYTGTYVKVAQGAVLDSSIPVETVGGSSESLALSTQGRLANIDCDLTSPQKMATVKWYAMVIVNG